MHTAPASRKLGHDHPGLTDLHSTLSEPSSLRNSAPQLKQTDHCTIHKSFVCQYTQSFCCHALGCDSAWALVTIRGFLPCLSPKPAAKMPPPPNPDWGLSDWDFDCSCGTWLPTGSPAGYPSFFAHFFPPPLSTPSYLRTFHIIMTQS